MYDIIIDKQSGKVCSIQKRLSSEKRPRVPGCIVKSVKDKPILEVGTNLKYKDDKFSAAIPYARINRKIIPHDVNKIIFKRTHKSIGDLCSILSAIQIAHKTYPNALICVLAPLPAREILLTHPAIHYLGEPTDKIDGTVIDLSNPCPAGEVETAMRDKINLSRHEIFTIASGLRWQPERPQLYLSEEEKQRGHEIAVTQNNNPRLGIVLQSAEIWKDWRHVYDFIELAKNDYEVFVYDKHESVKGVNNIVGYPIRDVMASLVYMDCVVTIDTAFVHLCEALNVPCVALYGSMQVQRYLDRGFDSSVTFYQGKCQYEKAPCMYQRCQGKGQYQPCMDWFTPEYVLNKTKEKISGYTGPTTIST